MTDTDLIIGLSEKSDGDMKLHEGDDNLEAKANRERYFKKLGIDPNQVIAAGLVQGDRIAIVGKADCGRLVPETDALITDTPGAILSVTVADCLPIYIYDPVHHAIGLVHAGWKGVHADIVGKTIARMVSEFGSNPPDIQAYIGPHLQACHFEVKDDVAQFFSNYPDAIISNEGRLHIDLSKIVVKQLAAAGVIIKDIETSEECTHDDAAKYFSYRRDKPERTPAMVAYIGIK